MKLYPNPANDYITGELLISNVSGSKVIIFDSQGKCVLTKWVQPKKQSFVISTEKLSTGIYIINLENEDKIVDSEKISINANQGLKTGDSPSL